MKLTTIDYHTHKKKHLLSHCLTHGLIKVQNHPVTDAQSLEQFSAALGTLLHWDFGAINELIYHPQAPNYLYSNEAVPFHWDGAFHTEPSFLIFHCVSTSQTGGETLFTDSLALLKQLSKKNKTVLENSSIQYTTEKKAHYGGSIDVSPIQTHPHTCAPILRYAEAVNTSRNPVKVRVNTKDENQANSIKTELKKHLYDPNICHTHQWQVNDLLIADNHRLLHARNQLQNNTQRHLRRCQIL